jgi:hypothetical protein
VHLLGRRCAQVADGEPVVGGRAAGLVGELDECGTSDSPRCFTTASEPPAPTPPRPGSRRRRTVPTERAAAPPGAGRGRGARTPLLLLHRAHHLTLAQDVALHGLEQLVLVPARVDLQRLVERIDLDLIVMRGVSLGRPGAEIARPLGGVASLKRAFWVVQARLGREPRRRGSWFRPGCCRSASGRRDGAPWRRDRP